METATFSRGQELNKETMEKLEEIAKRYNRKDWEGASSFTFPHLPIKVGGKVVSVGEYLDNSKERWLYFIRRVYELQGRKDVEEAVKAAEELWDAVKWDDELRRKYGYKAVFLLYMLAQHKVKHPTGGGILHIRRLKGVKNPDSLRMLKEGFEKAHLRVKEWYEMRYNREAPENLYELRRVVYSDRDYWVFREQTSRLSSQWVEKVRTYYSQSPPLSSLSQEGERREIDGSLVPEKGKGKGEVERRERVRGYVLVKEREDGGKVYVFSAKFPSEVKTLYVNVVIVTDKDGKVVYVDSVPHSTWDAALKDLDRNAEEAVEKAGVGKIASTTWKILKPEEKELKDLLPLLQLYVAGESIVGKRLGKSGKKVRGEEEENKDEVVEGSTVEVELEAVKDLKKVVKLIENRDWRAQLVLDVAVEGLRERKENLSQVEIKALEKLESARNKVAAGDWKGAKEDVEEAIELLKNAKREEVANLSRALSKAFDRVSAYEAEVGEPVIGEIKEESKVVVEKDVERMDEEKAKEVALAIILIDRMLKNNRNYPPEDVREWLKETLERMGEKGEVQTSPFALSAVGLPFAGELIPWEKLEGEKGLEGWLQERVEDAKDVYQAWKEARDRAEKEGIPFSQAWAEVVREKRWSREEVERKLESARLMRGLLSAVGMGEKAMELYTSLHYAPSRLYQLPEELGEIRSADGNYVIKTREDLAQAMEDRGLYWLADKVREGLLTEKEMELVRKELERDFSPKAVSQWWQEHVKKHMEPVPFLRKDQASLLGRETLKRLEQEGVIREAKVGAGKGYLVADWERVERELERKAKEMEEKVEATPNLKALLELGREMVEKPEVYAAYNKVVELLTPYLLDVAGDVDFLTAVNDLEEMVKKA